MAKRMPLPASRFCVSGVDAVPLLTERWHCLLMTALLTKDDMKGSSIGCAIAKDFPWMPALSVVRAKACLAQYEANDTVEFRIICSLKSDFVKWFTIDNCFGAACMFFAFRGKIRLCVHSSKRQKAMASVFPLPSLAVVLCSGVAGSEALLSALQLSSCSIEFQLYMDNGRKVLLQSSRIFCSSPDLDYAARLPIVRFAVIGVQPEQMHCAVFYCWNRSVLTGARSVIGRAADGLPSPFAVDAIFAIIAFALIQKRLETRHE